MKTLAIETTYNVEFGTPDGVSLKFDLIKPSTDKLVPAIICIHGGGWISGGKEEMHDLALLFARSGFAAICPQYRLAPLYPYPAAVHDITAMLAMLRSKGNEYGIVSSAIGSIGNSAGGHLSSCLATGDDDRVEACVNVCGIVDLTNPSEQHEEVAWDFLQQFMGQPFKGNETLWADASPLFRVTSETSPMLIVHGAKDDVVDVSQSVRLKSALTDAGVDCEFLLLDGEGHSFSPSGFEQIMQSSIEFFEKRLKRS